MMHPGNVFNNGNLDWREVVVPKVALLCLGPSQAELIEFENVLQKFQFLWPKKVALIQP